MATENFEGPWVLDNWPNDDLVLQEATREHLYSVYPEAARIFDASDLHDLFKEHELPANSSKKKSRRWGKVAIGLGMASILTAAIMPVALTNPTEGEHLLAGVLGTLVCLLTVTSASIGYWKVLRGASRNAWIKHRLWTERLRQFHFQFIVNNTQLATQAVESQDFQAWDSARAREFALFTEQKMRSTSDALLQVIDDDGEHETWLSDDWRPTPKNSAPAISPSLLELWREQRLGIQLRYTRLTLGAKNGDGKRRQTRLMLNLIYGLTFGAIASSLVLAFLALAGNTGMPLAIAQATLAIFGGGSIAARALEEGMGFEAERNRMEWYLAALQGIGGRLQYATTSRDQLELMRDLERLSYQEMHRFFVTMSQARFII